MSFHLLDTSKIPDNFLGLWHRVSQGRRVYEPPSQLGFFDLTHRYNAFSQKSDPLDPLSFMRFLGLDLHQQIPDAKAIWWFWETLAKTVVVEALFKQFDAYLAAHVEHVFGHHVMAMVGELLRTIGHVRSGEDTSADHLLIDMSIIT
ncbi:MAG: transposase [Nitrospirales bacterium]|nr:transposase [Nitrospirales bacterium]